MKPFFLTLSVFAGFIGAMIPNDKSNIPHWLMAILFGVLTVKVVYGDFDLVFYPFVSILALIGYYMSKNSSS